VTGGASLPYVHAPFEAILFVQFARLSYVKAYLLWVAVNTGMLLLLRAILAPHFSVIRQHTWALWIFALASFFPVFFTILEGQDSVVLLLLYGLSLVNMKRGSWFAAGCWLALGLFRFHLVLPFVAIMFLTRRWRFVLGFLLGSAFVAGLSAAVVGWPGLWRYPKYLWFLERHRGEQILSPSANCNFRGLMAWILPRSTGLFLFLVLVISLSVIAVWLTVKTWKRVSAADQSGMELAFSVSILTAILVSYHGFMYDLGLLVLPILIVLNRYALTEAVQKRADRGLLLPIGILFFSPLYLAFSHTPVHHSFIALILSFWAWALMRRSALDSKAIPLCVEARAHQ
jgi:Glycosyltransferase family 87